MPAARSTPPTFDAVVVSCEHASAAVPAAYRDVLAPAGPVLGTHRGVDIGAAPVARALARRLDAPVFLGRATRLLVDLNRSLHHRSVFSTWTQPLPDAARARIVDDYYHPYRGAVARAIDAHLAAGRRVLHVSVHSFTPVLDGAPRRADVGLLYDPGRARERQLCAAWREHMRADAPDLRVRRNYPYSGVQDGLAPALRATRSARRYAVVEVELSQGLVSERAGQRRATALLADLVSAALNRPESAAARAGRPRRSR